MDPIRPLAGITVVIVFATAVATGLQLDHISDRQRSTIAPAPVLSPPTAGSAASPTVPSQPRADPTGPAIPAPQALPADPRAHDPQVPPAEPGAPNPQAPPPAPPRAAPPLPLPAAPLPPRSSVVRRPAAPSPTQIAQARAAERHALAYARLRRQAIQLCRQWGFSRARCDTAPK